jgi:hypothetical protein
MYVVFLDSDFDTRINIQHSDEQNVVFQDLNEVDSVVIWT